MITIDLTPLAVRHSRIGRMRLVELCATILGVAAAVIICAVALQFVTLSADTTALTVLQREVASLEQHVKRQAEDRQQALRNRELNLTREAQRQLIPTVLDLASVGASKSVSLSKLHITSSEAILEGYAEDARAISYFVESVVERCPRIQAAANKVHAVLISGRSVESFSVRLRFSLESYGASWCRQGDSNGG